MHYFLHVNVGGLYVASIKSRDTSDPRAIAVHSNGVIVDADATALSKGCSPGTKVSEAKVVLRDEGRLVELVPTEFIDARNEWLDVCLTVSHLIEAGPPHCATISLAGHPDQIQAATDLVRLLATQTPYTLHAGLSNAPWVARRHMVCCDPMAAKLGLTCLEPVTSDTEAFQRMPTRWLDPVDEKIRERLCFLGYRRVGDVARAPQSVLTRQFGKLGIVARQAALGQSVHAMRPNYPNDSVTSHVRFGFPCQDALMIDQALSTLSREIAQQLTQSASTANESVLVFHFEGALPSVVRKKHPKPVQRAETLKAFYSQAHQRQQTRRPLHAIAALATNLVTAQTSQTTLCLSRQHRSSPSPDHALALVKSAFGDSALQVANQIDVPRRKRLLQLWRNTTGWM